MTTIDISNPHDCFFKEVFSKTEAARDFLATQLPSDLVGALELNRLELVNGHFVDDRLKEHYSDLLYKVGLKSGGDAFVYVLLAEILGLLAQLTDEQDGLSFLRTLLIYIGCSTDKIDDDFLHKEVQETFSSKGVEVMNTIAQHYIQRGMQQGMQQGVQQGFLNGMREDICDVLVERFGECPKSVSRKLSQMDDVDKLRELLRLSIRVSSVKEFQI